MKKRTIVLSIVMCFVGVALCAAAENSMLGTWKLNEAKSKIPAGASKSVTVVYAAAGDDLKCSIDGVNGEGKPTHTEWTGKIDGKDYAVTGDPNQSTRSLKKINDHTFEVTVKKGDKVTISGRLEISPNGKSRTVILSGTDAAGNKIQTASFYDKQ
jgi:hypothetical protein